MSNNVAQSVSIGRHIPIVKQHITHIKLRWWFYDRMYYSFLTYFLLHLWSLHIKFEWFTSNGRNIRSWLLMGTCIFVHVYGPTCKWPHEVCQSMCTHSTSSRSHKTFIYLGTMDLLSFEETNGHGHDVMFTKISSNGLQKWFLETATWRVNFDRGISSYIINYMQLYVNKSWTLDQPYSEGFHPYYGTQTSICDDIRRCCNLV